MARRCRFCPGPSSASIFRIVCVQTVKAQTRLCECEGSSEISLFAYLTYFSSCNIGTVRVVKFSLAIKTIKTILTLLRSTINS